MDAPAGFTMDVQPRNSPRHTDPQATPDQRTYALFMHLSILLFHVVLPVAPVLILWLIKRRESHFIDDHGKEALNFQISLILYAAVSTTLVPICALGLIGYAVIYALGIVGMVMAAVAANRGEYFRYPATLRLIS